MIPIISELLSNAGLEASNEIQFVEGIWIYPHDYFNPLDSLTGKLNITENTRSIHWYMASWVDAKSRRLLKIKRFIRRILGSRIVSLLKPNS